MDRHDELAPRDAVKPESESDEIVMARALQGGSSTAHGGVLGTGGELGLTEPWDDRPASDDEAVARDRNEAGR